MDILAIKGIKGIPIRTESECYKEDYAMKKRTVVLALAFCSSQRALLLRQQYYIPLISKGFSISSQAVKQEQCRLPRFQCEHYL